MAEINCVLVLRNKLWCNNAIPVLQNIWHTIVRERKEGYMHRAPKKKVKGESNKKNTHNESLCYEKKCFIQLDTDEINDIDKTNKMKEEFESKLPELLNSKKEKKPKSSAPSAPIIHINTEVISHNPP